MKKITIIDEKTGNPFPVKIPISAAKISMGMMPISTEGYCHNDPLIKDTTKKLAKIIGLSYGQKIMDVGYGTNLSVAEAMSEIGMDSYGLDFQDGSEKKEFQNPLFVPPYFNAEQNGVKTYCGTIEDILHKDSELKDQRFDLFTFWGSWESGGHNYAIGGEIGWFRAVEELKAKYGPISLEGGNWDPYNNPEVSRQMVETRNKILLDSKSLLNPNGRIMMVSSRYARHGAGFSTEQLPLEKRAMLRLAYDLSDSGAQEICLIGLSKEEVSTQLRLGKGFEKVVHALWVDSVLFGLERGPYEPAHPRRIVKAIKKMNIPLGRIDAVYGGF